MAIPRAGMPRQDTPFAVQKDTSSILFQGEPLVFAIFRKPRRDEVSPVRKQGAHGTHKILGVFFARACRNTVLFRKGQNSFAFSVGKGETLLCLFRIHAATGGVGGSAARTGERRCHGLLWTLPGCGDCQKAGGFAFSVSIFVYPGPNAVESPHNHNAKAPSGGAPVYACVWLRRLEGCEHGV